MFIKKQKSFSTKINLYWNQFRLDHSFFLALIQKKIINQAVKKYCYRRDKKKTVKNITSYSSKCVQKFHLMIRLLDKKWQLRSLIIIKSIKF